MDELEYLQNQELLAGANQRANQHDILAAVAAMSNNAGAAQAAKMAAADAQRQFAPQRLGNQGFMVPETGQFVPSKIYVDEQNAAREAKKSALQASIEAKAEQERIRQADREAARADRSALAQTLASMNGQNRLDVAALRGGMSDDKAAAKADKALGSNIQKYTATLEKAGIPEFGQALGLVEGTLSKYKPGELPAYGRFMSAVPGALLGNEGQGVRADMAQAANILLKSRSGAAVTESETRRFLQEIASGTGMDEQTLRRGWANVRKTFDAKRQNISSSIDDATHQEYLQRGGQDYRLKPPAAPASGGGAPLSPEEQAELEALRKRLGKK